MANKNMNADGTVGSGSIDVNPVESTNERLGIGDYATGTSASREGCAFGGGENDGLEPISAKSAAKASLATNAGSANDTDSSDERVGITEKFGASGTVASRENMTYGGDTNKKGRIYGQGAGAIPQVDAKSVLLGNNKVFDVNLVMQGTDEAKEAYLKSIRGSAK